MLGLAPAAHGANRTGRVFTGDRSGDWLFAAMYRAGFANQPTSTHVDDGLALRDAYVTAAVKCAPPENKPRPDERAACSVYLESELALLTELQVVLCLGHFAWDTGLRMLRSNELGKRAPAPRFGHGSVARLGNLSLIGSYHPSQQNTFTGKLTESMLDDVFGLARDHLAADG